MTPIPFDNSYSRLSAEFYAKVKPKLCPRPTLVYFNEALARELGLDALNGEERLGIFSGNQIPVGADPIAMAYAGHQFGHFSAQLGDGRAILIGEVVDRHGRRRDLQLKGSGPTPFSRGGDGNAALGPVIRELIVSEAMHALGIPTTRTLAAVTTGDLVFRERPLAGARLTRVAASHLRIGTFEYFAARGNLRALRELADYALKRHFADREISGDPYLILLDAVVGAQASLVASWMQIGFIHGVMNTDNMTISGETIDYGPCAFMDEYQSLKVLSFIDRSGRYAFANQARIAKWNLACFAGALFPLMPSAVERAKEIVQSFSERFENYWLAGMARKLGLSRVLQGDKELVKELFDLMEKTQADFTVFFSELSSMMIAENPERLRPFGEWLKKWRGRLMAEPLSPAECVKVMQTANPIYIPRNHRVAGVIQAADEGDFSKLHEMMKVLSRPFEKQPELHDYALPPRPSERVLQTFCGT